MTTKVGINGFGRIGRLAFRRIMDLGEKTTISKCHCHKEMCNN